MKEYEKGKLYPQYFIYFLYHLNEIVYIGFTHDVNKRIRDHKRDKMFDRHSFLPIKYRMNGAHEIELELIKMFKPILNGDVLCKRKDRKKKITKYKEKELV